MARSKTNITTFSLAASAALKEIKATLEQRYGMGVTLLSNTIRAYEGDNPKPLVVYRVVLDNVQAQWLASSCMDLRKADRTKQELTRIGPIAEVTKEDIIADFWRRYESLLED